MWHYYPMGPEVRGCLGFPPISAAESSSGEAADKAGFAAFLQGELRNFPVVSSQHLGRLLDELLAMDLPEVVLALAEQWSVHLQDNDLQQLLACGGAAMLCAQLERAEGYFRAAQRAAPLEPAPYVNTVQIMLTEGRREEAWQWCLSCLAVEANHYPLWHLLVSTMEQRLGALDLPELRTLAERFNSWAGMSLVATLSAENTPSLKVDLLKPYYEAGELNPQFLLEYTGALGAAELYEGIPAIIWRAKKLAAAPLPWKLLLHGAQAQLALGDEMAFQKAVQGLRRRKDLPQEVHEYLDELIS